MKIKAGYFLALVHGNWITPFHVNSSLQERAKVNIIIGFSVFKLRC